MNTAPHVTVEPFAWTMRVNTPGTCHPKYGDVIAVLTAIKIDGDTVRIQAAHGKWGALLRETFESLKALGFHYVTMDRHGKERKYAIDRMIDRCWDQNKEHQ